MNNVYLYLILFTPLFPLLLSFDKKVRFVKNWKPVFLASLLIAIPFLVWDEFFTRSYIWGFTEKYLLGYSLGHLPLEEVAFFIVVPFACTFIYECVKAYFNQRDFKWFNYLFFIAMVSYCGIVFANNTSGLYTIFAASSGIVVLLLLIRNRSRFKYIPMAFVISLLPFLLVNGVLTGSFIDEPVVWYNASQFSQLRIGSIPAEDVIYGFSLIASNVMVFEILKRKFRSAK